MKKIISLVLLGCITTIASSQVSYTGTVSSENMGLSADVGIRISGNIGPAGIEFDQQITSFRIKSFTAVAKTISGSQIPSDVVTRITNDVRPTATYEVYVNGRLLKRYGANTSVSWTDLLGLPYSEGSKQTTKDAGKQLYSSGAIAIRNVEIQSYSCHYCATYAQKLAEENANSVSKTSSNSTTGSGSTNVTVGGSTGSNAATSYSANTTAPPQTKLQRDYETGQAISGVANSLLDLFPNADERAKKWEADANYGKQLETNFEEREKEQNETLELPESIAKNIQAIPYMLFSPSISWETLLGTNIYNNIFGNTIAEVTPKLRTFGGSKKQVQKNIDAGNVDFIVQPGKFAPFYAVRSGDQIEYPMKTLGNSDRYRKPHDLDLVVDENNIIIGVSIKLHTSYSLYEDWYISIDDYINSIIGRTNGLFIALPRSTFLLKDKVIYFEYDRVTIYDLNYIHSKTYLGAFKVPGFGIKFNYYLDSEISNNKNFITYELTRSIKLASKLKFIKTVSSNLGVTIGPTSGAAEKAGLKEGDIITSIQGMDVKMVYMMQLILAGYSNETLDVIYLRDGVSYQTRMKT